MMNVYLLARPLTCSKFADFGDGVAFYSKILKPNKELNLVLVASVFAINSANRLSK